MAEADVDPSPVRAAHMFRCPVCDAKGKTGTTLGFGGTPCSLCQGRCYLKREPTACPSCDAKGGFASLFGLKWNTCRLCHSVKYLIDKPFPCPKCRATGLIKGLGGVFSSPCDLCDRQRYLKHVHGRCIKCNFSSALAKFFRKCTNCTGIGYSPEPQHLCPRCNSSGRFKGNSCMLCGGGGVIHHEVVACAKCNGAGEIKRTLSLIMGKASCPTCNGQGYFQVFSSASSITVPPKPARKRSRNGSDDEKGTDVNNGYGDADDDHRGGGQAGGSEPRRRVRLRPTPVKDGGRRQTISSFEPGGPQPTPARAASYTGMATPASTLYGRSRDDIDIMRSTGGGGAGAGAGVGADGDDAAGVFRPGVGSVEGGTGKRRRGH